MKFRFLVELKIYSKSRKLQAVNTRFVGVYLTIQELKTDWI